MKKFLKLSFTAVIAIFAIATISSCKKNFDNPPSYINPNLVANTTIKALKALHQVSGNFDAVTTDIIISGIVVANDKSGNFYKEIYIQDATGAIALELDATDVYTTYAVGRMVFVKCKGLTLSDYHSFPQLGMMDNSVPGVPALGGIPATLIYNFVIAGSSGNTVPYTVVSNYAALNSSAGNAAMQDSLLGRLIRLDGYEFTKSNLSQTYADTSAYKNSINLTINNCSGNSLFVRSSGYANFAGLYPAAGNGSIYGIYTIYKASSTTTSPDKQLIIRDTSDVQFTGPRCNLFEEDFGSLGSADNGLDFAFTGWKNIAPNSTANYKNSIFGATGKVVKVTAFGTALAADTAWLITPAIAIPAGATPKFSFTTSYQFALGPTILNAYISTNYNGSNTPGTSTWTQLTTNTMIPGNSATNNSSTFSAFAGTGDIPLAAYAGMTVYIAWKYIGSVPLKTTNYEIDDIRITRQ